MWLKELRKEWGLSQAALAAHTNISRSMVSMMERLDKEPSIDTILELAEVFDKPPEAVFLMVVQREVR